MMAEAAKRPKVNQHDEAPSGITDHAFAPKGEWYTLCRICNRAEAAHAETVTPVFDSHRYGPTCDGYHYISDDIPEEDDE